MKAIMLALWDYRNHTTDEGWQLQEGLRLAGVELWGKGYAHSERHVPAILDAAQPDVVILSDYRDWDPSNGGAYDKTAGFTGIQALFHHRCVLPVFKDAASCLPYQCRYHEQIAANGWICYYHPKSVCRYAAWVDPDYIIRTYHTIDPAVIPNNGAPRNGTIISGARNADVYPLRDRIMAAPGYFGVDVRNHPGYGNKGSDVAEYYHALSKYRVSIATASRYGFALRKIIEAVACGCTAISDLPEYDHLPDVPILRVSPIEWGTILWQIIRNAEDRYDPKRADQAAAKVIERYDYRVEGRRLYQAIEEFWRARN